MSGEEPADLDPEVLADSGLVDPEDDQDPEAPIEPEVVDVGSSAMVPSGERSLARADPFRRYLSEVRKYPPLTREQERELAVRYRDTGDREALFRLITANLMLVVHSAWGFRRAAHNLLDLVQEGNIGLLQAIEKFDPELGNRLPTYATYWIRAYMIKFLLDNVRQVRVGTTNARRKLLRNLRREKERLAAEGFEVGPRLLAEHFGVSEQDVREVEAALASRDLPLDAPAGPDDDRARSEVFADEDEPTVEEHVARRQLQSRTEAALARFRDDLSERDTMILDERILSDDPLTLQALGDRFGTSREAVRQAEARLMKKLTVYVKEQLGDLGKIKIGPN